MGAMMLDRDPHVRRGKLRAPARSTDTGGARRARPADPPSARRTSPAGRRSVSWNARSAVVVVEIADVLADERLAVHDQRDRVLQIGAERENRPRRRTASPRRPGRSRGRAAERRGRAARARTTESSTRRAIGRSPTRNASAMPASRSRASSILVGDRLARSIGAGHHQHVRRAGREQQMVQRRVGQHHARARRCRARRSSEVDARAGASTIGPRGTISSASASGESSTSRARHGEIPRHERERLLLAELPLAQRSHRGRVARVARQVVAADPLDRHDGARAEQRRRRG